MESTRSWAKDYGKRRYDVTVQEVDLLRMLAEMGADDLAGTAARMRTVDVQLIMDCEAQAFVHLSLSKEDGEPRDVHRAKAKEFRDARDTLLRKYVPEPKNPE